DAQDIVDRIGKASDGKSAQAAATQVLEAAGFDVVKDLAHLRTSHGDKTRPDLTEAQAALEGIEQVNLGPHTGRITLEEFATLLGGVLGKRITSGAGDGLREFLQGITDLAETHPGEPFAAAPLLLNGLVKQRHRDIDLQVADYRPSDLELSLLELQL